MSVRCGRCTTLLLLAGAGGLVLEYLGQWEASDEEWVMIDRQISLETEERTDPAPRGEESTEKDDER